MWAWAIGHVKNIPTMQFFIGISRITQSKSYMLSLTVCVWNFKIMLCGLVINTPYYMYINTAKVLALMPCDIYVSSLLEIISHSIAWLLPVVVKLSYKFLTVGISKISRKIIWIEQLGVFWKRTTPYHTVFNLTQVKRVGLPKYPWWRAGILNEVNHPTGISC